MYLICLDYEHDGGLRPIMLYDEKSYLDDKIKLVKQKYPDKKIVVISMRYDFIHDPEEIKRDAMVI